MIAKSLIGAVVGVLMAMTQAGAATLNFNFSFTGNTSDGLEAGTVTGEIFGLTDNATSSPTSVEILSYTTPTGASSFPSAPFTVTPANYATIFSTTFTVTAGQITAANFVVLITDLNAHGFYIELDCNAPCSISPTNGANTLFDAAVGPTFRSDSGVAGAHYTLASATPLPAALPLFATVLGALGLLGWRRRRKNAAALAA
jgi:hypothetical protein